jgi:hypothetical protein
MTSKNDDENPELGRWRTGDWSIEQRLAALAAFLPILSAPDFQAGVWNGAEDHGDAIVMGWFEFGPEAKRFVQTAYDYGWVIDIDWPEWNRAEEAQALYQDPEILAQASATQLSKFLTARIRVDRFVEGSLAADFKSGLMTRIAARASTLLGIN